MTITDTTEDMIVCACVPIKAGSRGYDAPKVINGDKILIGHLTKDACAGGCLWATYRDIKEAFLIMVPFDRYFSLPDYKEEK